MCHFPTVSQRADTHGPSLCGVLNSLQFLNHHFLVLGCAGVTRHNPQQATISQWHRLATPSLYNNVAKADTALVLVCTQQAKAGILTVPISIILIFVNYLLKEYTTLSHLCSLHLIGCQFYYRFDHYSRCIIGISLALPALKALPLRINHYFRSKTCTMYFIFVLLQWSLHVLIKYIIM